jgi:hypothetical protein|tara:strand:+ start:201 stop:719 length:519 start_codon:yes stop_codon:yes gene_type:complete
MKTKTGDKMNNERNYTNSDGSFNREKWLNWMNAAIQSIPFIGSWSGHTVKVVNQLDKKINWTFSSDHAKNNPHTVDYPTFHKDTRFQVWDEAKGFVDCLTSPSNYVKDEMEVDKVTLFKVQPIKWGPYVNYKFLVLYPNKEWRFLGLWEFDSYGLKKYVPYAIQAQLKKLGV